MAFYIYILKCADNSYYTGHTDDIEKRLNEHYQGKSPCYTQKRRPIKLVFMQDFSSRYEALTAERKIKKWTRRKKEALMYQGWEGLLKLTKEENRGR